MKQATFREKLTITGIAIGVYAVLIISVICASGKEIFNNQLGKMGFNCITISATDKQLNKLSPVDLAYVKTLDGVVQASPVIFNIGQASTKVYVGDTVVCGIDKSTSKILEISLLHGRFFSNSDIEKNAKVCIIDESLALEFYKRSNIVGKEIEIQIGEGKDTYKVIGVTKNEDNPLVSLIGEYTPSFVYLPFTTQMNATGRGSIDQIFLKLDNTINYDLFGEEVSQKLSKRAGYVNLYKSGNLAVQKEKLDGILQTVTAILLCIGSISFLVSGLSIMTIMLANIKEKTREIGIKKAIGASELDIGIDFLKAALKLSISGCSIAIMLAGASLVVLSIFLKDIIIVPFSEISILLLISVAIGVIFGVYPAMVAAALNPVDALRNE